MNGDPWVLELATKELGVIRAGAGTDPRNNHTEGTAGKRSPYGRDSGEEKPVKETERQQLERQEENQARRRKC